MRVIHAVLEKEYFYTIQMALFMINSAKHTSVFEYSIFKMLLIEFIHIPPYVRHILDSAMCHLSCVTLIQISANISDGAVNEKPRNS